jgi:hypothetical protein
MSINKFRIGEIRREVTLAYDLLPQKFTSSDLDKLLQKFGLKTTYMQRHSELKKLQEYGLIEQVKASSHYWIKKFPNLETYFQRVVYALAKEREKYVGGAQQ